MKYNEVIKIFVILTSPSSVVWFCFSASIPNCFHAQLDVYFAYSKIIYYSASRLIIALQMQQGYLGNAHVDKDVGWFFDYLRICDCMDNFKQLLFFFPLAPSLTENRWIKKHAGREVGFNLRLSPRFITTLPL